MAKLGSSLGFMDANIPTEVIQAINRLRSEAEEKTRIADDLERHYTSIPARQKKSSVASSSHAPLKPPEERIVTIEQIRARVEERGSRSKDLADFFDVPEAAILAAISSSGSKLTIADRGWVKSTNS